MYGRGPAGQLRELGFVLCRGRLTQSYKPFDKIASEPLHSDSVSCSGPEQLSRAHDESLALTGTLQ